MAIQRPAQHGAVGQNFDVLSLWQDVSRSEVSGRAVNCGHYLAEEQPEEVLRDMQSFFGG